MLGHLDNDGNFIELNGNVLIRSLRESADENGQTIAPKVVYVGSNNSLKLKDTEWFKNNRIMPNAWKN